AAAATKGAPAATQGALPAGEERPNARFGGQAKDSGGPAAEAIPAGGRNLAAEKEVHLLTFMSEPASNFGGQGSLWVVLLIAIGGLLYAGSLVNYVLGADEGTTRMREIAAAVRQGANAYLARQFKAVILLLFLLAALIWASAGSGSPEAGVWGRVGAFVMGATVSWLVGFVGMSLAVRGNLRVAAAARTSYGTALQLGYRTGTITGMLTDGLGLLGGTLIFMAYGEHAYEVLLGFGFGGTLLALFMR